ncbi:unnamed protein product [marine sediment metagenome]|uniref:Uncharacterized protein n=1 Tax=marine sediment metagenome TaxID=412755 RepID=X1TVY9_9ZZZZ
MPSQKVHMELSKERTGQTFEELHAWIDEPQKFIGFNHRIERHSYYEDYKKYIEKKWGEKGVVEWLFHIAIDNIETAHKFAKKAYLKAYEEIVFEFDGEELGKCHFTKKFKSAENRTCSYLKKK